MHNRLDAGGLTELTAISIAGHHADSFWSLVCLWHSGPSMQNNRQNNPRRTPQFEDKKPSLVPDCWLAAVALRRAKLESGRETPHATKLCVRARQLPVARKRMIGALESRGGARSGDNEGARASYSHLKVRRKLFSTPGKHHGWHKASTILAVPSVGCDQHKTGRERTTGRPWDVTNSGKACS